MADIRAFRAIRYHFDQNMSPEDVLAPPYDVIEAAEQDALYARHRANIIRLILNREQAADSSEDNRYTRARRHLMDGLARGDLRQDHQPGLYAHEQTFSDAQGRTHTRRGFLGAVRLAAYEEGVVLPHERTLRGPKVDRLELMKACEANLSPIFFLYDDPTGEVDKLLKVHREEAMEVALTTEDDGIKHQLWPVFEADAQAKIAEVLKDSQLLIADGHHRYETALAYRDFRRSVAEGEADPDAPYEFVMAFMVNMHDPGLQVFGTHRMVQAVEGFSLGGLLEKLEASAHFSLERLNSALKDDAAALEAHLAKAGEARPSFILTDEQTDEPILVQYLGDESSDIFDAKTPAHIRRLDVSILHEGILDRLIGIDKEAQAAQTNLQYYKSLEEALAGRKEPGNQLLILMNPTPVSQVVEVCQLGGKMPQKSTYFHPKILSGLTINPL